MTPANGAVMPWDRILERVDCMRNDPTCRQGLIVHASILGLVFILAVFRKILVANGMTAESLDKRSAAESQLLTSKTEIDSIIVYPIKSCAGVRLQNAQITTKGLELDRRWMVVKKDKNGAWQKMSLREEAKLTLIQPSITESSLRLELSSLADASSSELPGIAIPLQARAKSEVISVAMWGDTADGLVVNEVIDSQWSDTPSSWVSQFLGYEVKLVQFDTSGPSRDAYPFYKPPALAQDTELLELKRPRGIEFQDEYPLLIATVESLKELQAQIRDAVLAADGTDGRGGAPVGGKLFKPDAWKTKVTSNDTGAKQIAGQALTSGQREEWLSMLRFRPNIVLKSSKGSTPIKAWEEDCWTKIQIDNLKVHLDDATDTQDQSRPSTVEMHLVSRCERCLLTTVDPETAERDVSVPLAFLRRSRNQVKKVPLDEQGKPKTGASGRPGPCFGIYAVVPEGKGGNISVGASATCIWSNDSNSQRRPE